MKKNQYFIYIKYNIYSIIKYNNKINSSMAKIHGAKTHGIFVHQLLQIN